MGVLVVLGSLVFLVVLGSLVFLVVLGSLFFFVILGSLIFLVVLGTRVILLRRLLVLLVASLSCLVGVSCLSPTPSLASITPPFPIKAH